MKKAYAYWKAARLVAGTKKKNLFWELVKLIQYKSLTGYGPELYLLYRLYEVNKTNWPFFIGKSQMSRMLHKVNDASTFHMMDDKVDFFLFCQRNEIPSPEILFSINASKEYDGIPNADTEEKFISCLEKLNSGRYIIKPIIGSYGEGIYSIQYHGGNVTDLKTGFKMERHRFYQELRHLPYLIQPCLSPNDNLKRIMPEPACGAIRVISYQKKDGDTVFPFSFITVPVKGQVISNFMHGSTGNLIAGVDSSSGELKQGVGVGASGLMESYSKHPDTNERFKDLRIQEWDEILTIAAKAAACFPLIRFIGWDFAATEDGIFIIEGNPMCDPDGLQVTLKRGIKEDLENLLQS